ncbi:MAG: hypothetical protein Q9210_004952, partial [Variospora velana]
MPQAPTLKLHTQLRSLYPILDLSGHLPFSIVFGLCRHSPTDVDPRPLVFSTAGSVLDVPYALGCGLLTLHMQDGGEAKAWIGVDVRRLRDVVGMGEEEWVSLPSPVGRVGSWRDAFTVIRCLVDINGALASILEVGRKYRIRMAGEDLGVRRWGYRNHDQVVDSNNNNNNNESTNDFEATRLVKSKITASNATFTVIRALSCPPRIETRLRLLSDVAGTTTGNLDLEVSVLNTSPDAITVQTRGHQHIPIPWGPFQPDPDADDNRMRIIHPTPHKSPISSLRVFDSATGELLRGNEKQGPCGPLTDGNVDQRPK